MTDAAQGLVGRQLPVLLLAHANPKVRRQLANGLRGGGCEVEEVSDGAWAVRRFASRMLRSGRPFDGVILHHDLRGWSGLQILDGLRDSDWFAPTVFLVDTGDQQTAHAARRRGAEVIIEWPLDVQDVRDAVLELVSGGHRSGVYPAV